MTSWRHIVDAYARGWAVPDLASVLPFDAMVAAAAATPSPLALKLAKLPRLLRLVKSAAAGEPEQAAPPGEPPAM